jgi:hypothetical protein
VKSDWERIGTDVTHEIMELNRALLQEWLNVRPADRGP